MNRCCDSDAMILNPTREGSIGEGSTIIKCSFKGCGKQLCHEHESGLNILGWMNKIFVITLCNECYPKLKKVVRDFMVDIPGDIVVFSDAVSLFSKVYEYVENDLHIQTVAMNALGCFTENGSDSDTTDLSCINTGEL